jgi:hypothetical protein
MLLLLLVSFALARCGRLRSHGKGSHLRPGLSRRVISEIRAWFHSGVGCGQPRLVEGKPTSSDNGGGLTVMRIATCMLDMI